MTDVRQVELRGKVVVVVGGPRSGKSNMLRHLMSRVDPAKVAAYDCSARGEFLGLAEAGGTVYKPRIATDTAEFIRWLRSVLPGDPAREGNEKPYRLSSPFDLVVIDEASLHMGRSKGQRRKEYLIISEMARHTGASFLFGVRRVQMLNNEVVANADIVIAFKSNNPLDRAKFNTYSPGMGIDVQSLPDYHYALFEDARGGHTLHPPVPEVHPWANPVTRRRKDGD